MGTLECLSFSGKDDEVIGDILRNETNTPIMLWVDRERGGFEQRFTDEDFAVQVVLRKIFS